MHNIQLDLVIMKVILVNLTVCLEVGLSLGDFGAE